MTSVDHEISSKRTTKHILLTYGEYTGYILKLEKYNIEMIQLQYKNYISNII